MGPLVLVGQIWDRCWRCHLTLKFCVLCVLIVLMAPKQMVLNCEVAQGSLRQEARAIMGLECGQKEGMLEEHLGWGLGSVKAESMQTGEDSREVPLSRKSLQKSQQLNPSASHSLILLISRDQAS